MNLCRDACPECLDAGSLLPEYPLEAWPEGDGWICRYQCPGGHRWTCWWSEGPRFTTSALLSVALERLPALTDYGVAAPGQLNRFLGPYLDEISAEERWKVDRNALVDSATMVAAVAGWLVVNLPPIKTVNSGSPNSYYLKHVAEKSVGYITNGVFIAAAAGLGYPIRAHPDSPNPCVGVSRRQLDKIIARATLVA